MFGEILTLPGVRSQAVLMNGDRARALMWVHQ